jgi:hypothetical protein
MGCRHPSHSGKIISAEIPPLFKGIVSHESPPPCPPHPIPMEQSKLCYNVQLRPRLTAGPPE